LQNISGVASFGLKLRSVNLLATAALYPATNVTVAPHHHCDKMLRIINNYRLASYKSNTHVRRKQTSDSSNEATVASGHLPNIGHIQAKLSLTWDQPWK
jgi:hypothetical protein